MAVSAADSATGLINEHVDVRGEHAQVIRAIGQASTVLLKNTNGALPLKGTEKQTALIGYDAGSNPWGANGCGDRGCDNGTLAMGWGSGTSNFPYLVTPEAAITQYVLTQTTGEVFTITDSYAYAQAVALATQADVAIVFANADSGEGYIDIDGNEGDRNNLTLWYDMDQMISNVTAVNPNTIVVLHTVGPVLITDWYDNENVTAILWCGLPGQESGNSLVDVLYGAYNPGGKLPFTLGAKQSDWTTKVLYEPNNGQFGAPQQDFTEGLLIDYRAFDANNIDPIYEFGYGLSYTTFSYSDLVITPSGVGPYVPASGMTEAAPTLGNFSPNPSDYLFPSDISRVKLYIYPYLNTTNLKAASTDPDYGESVSDFTPAGASDSSPQPIPAAGGAPGGNPSLYDIVATVTATITNTGSVTGDEVPQLYVALGADEPPKVLRGFDRLTIPAGGTTTFTVNLERRDVSTWDVASQDWVQVCNPTIYVGSSSRKLPLSGVLNAGCGTSSSPPSESSPSYNPGGPISTISDGQPQAPTGTVSAVSTISDHQPQAPTATAVSTISDHQPQAPTATAVSTISDHQPQAPTATAVSTISDHQPQAPTATETAVSEKSEGQPQAPTSA